MKEEIVPIGKVFELPADNPAAMAVATILVRRGVFAATDRPGVFVVIQSGIKNQKKRGARCG